MPNLFNDASPVRTTDLICFSHLRWRFVFQRPQHLMTRFARYSRVFFFEEFLEDANDIPFFSSEQIQKNIWVIVPHLRKQMTAREKNIYLQELSNQLIKDQNITSFVAWYYTPMALSFTKQLSPIVTVYDCMDELSAFKNAPVELAEKEQELFRIANIVFTGGESLYHAKRLQHRNVHLFPSSVDIEHFSKARNPQPEPEDQKNIPYPRLGFFGVLDERLDITLLKSLAEQKKDWHFILLGPVVKIEYSSLPHASNIHYPGLKDYNQLPNYISNWDVAILPFAINESTRFISPTKTPEYLAAGKPVVSTPVNDVVSTYGKKDFVHIAADTTSFITAVEKALKQSKDPSWLTDADNWLSQTSWNKTWNEMAVLLSEEIINANLYV